MHMISHEQEIAPGAWSMKMMAVRWGHKDCLLKEADKLSTYVYAKGDWIPSLTYNVVDLTEVADDE